MSVETKQAASSAVSEKLKEWIDSHTAIALASAENEAEVKAIKRMRHLYLDDYWYTVAPKIAEMFVES